MKTLYINVYHTSYGSRQETGVPRISREEANGVALVDNRKRVALLVVKVKPKSKGKTWVQRHGWLT